MAMTEAPLKPFGQNIWLCDGDPITAALGFHYPTRMIVVRLTGGGIFLWSPVALTPERAKAVTEIGPVQMLVAPNGLHDSYLGHWADAYPEAQVFAAPGLAEKRPDLTIHRTITEGPGEWSADIDHVIFAGNQITTEVVFFHRDSGTVIFTDLLQQFPRRWFSGWRGWVARADLMCGPEPAVPRKFRLATTDRRAARAARDRILGWPARQVVMAHGTPVTHDAPTFLRRAFRWL